MGKNIFMSILLIMSLSTTAFSLNMLRTAQQIDVLATEAYDDIRNNARGETGRKAATVSGQEAVAPAPAPAPMPAPSLDIPDLVIDFAYLSQINADATAWLYSPDTPIDYPVVWASDYNYYLRRLPDGKENANGSLFTDYNSLPDFAGHLTVIYGHNMKSGQMFGSLTQYKSQKYYDEHPYLYLYTSDESYRLEVIYGFVVGEGKWRGQAFMFEENLTALLSYASYNTTFISQETYEPGDRLIALSTCSYEFDDARYVLLARLRSDALE